MQVLPANAGSLEKKKKKTAQNYNHNFPSIDFKDVRGVIVKREAVNKYCLHGSC